ncbi:hypothetical protein TNCV_4481531 [Trichonephila clavipes]|nr:hypothetical protein TNCV_4481531 [Trichonephila clavipes]
MRSTTSVRRTFLHPTVTYPHYSCLISSNTTTDFRESSPRLIEDETFNDSDIINNLINYEDGQEAGFFESG